MSELNTANLRKLRKILKEGMGQVRVGILGSSARTGGGPSNAQIGAAHEFGTTTLPVRSFLRMPLTEHLAPALETSGAFEKEAIKDVIRLGTMQPWLVKVGILAEGVVAEAFDTGGWGQWPPSDMTRKKNHATLVETTQLRDSITSEVKA